MRERTPLVGSAKRARGAALAVAVAAIAAAPGAAALGNRGHGFGGHRGHPGQHLGFRSERHAGYGSGRHRGYGSGRHAGYGRGEHEGHESVRPREHGSGRHRCHERGKRERHGSGERERHGSARDPDDDRPHFRRPAHHPAETKPRTKSKPKSRTKPKQPARCGPFGCPQLVDSTQQRATLPRRSPSAEALAVLQRPGEPRLGGSGKSARGAPGRAPAAGHGTRGPATAAVAPLLTNSSGSGLSFGVLVAAISLLGVLAIVLLRLRRDEDEDDDDEAPAALE
ncbi:MAG: hypothetical protein ACJ760_16020 [Thermoleophilaceae bacterium]